MNHIASILPIAIYLGILKTMDGFALASWKRVLIAIGFGIGSCLTTIGLTLAFTWQAGYISPLVEETLKALPLIVLVMRKKIAFFAEALIYGVAIGAGFALLENTVYLLNNPGMSFLEATIRGFGTALLHMGCTASVAIGTLYLYRLCKPRYDKWPAPARLLASIALGAAALVLPVGIHTLYNLFLIPPILQLMVTIAVFMLFFMGIYSLDERLIHSWLDLSISNDIGLLAAIKKGKLSTTKAGQYLISIRERFAPDVFFDMYVYTQLYLELSIGAKSRLILREADMDMPIDEPTHQANMQKLAELKALRQRIGSLGLSVLNPLVEEKSFDKWALKELL